MFFTYIITNRKQGALYTGHTEDLVFRMQQHIEGVFEGFSKEHDCKKLMWFELHETRDGAFERERRIKEWKRRWKIEMLEQLNTNWDDLYINISEADIYNPARYFDQNTYNPKSGDGPRFSTG
ncbi:GIY-YIG nuclease family protein [Robiginitomaculum antarcticum]|uniref:GIY-YIG nuclease family protein n=1 Tax=Robiginitomaculum antarcticum TaxID=437507 RepID=UPI00037830E6|nr:GIY-YIG nuclease family protein [Robiginitomaculum antarcticum]